VRFGKPTCRFAGSTGLGRSGLPTPLAGSSSVSIRKGGDVRNRSSNHGTRSRWATVAGLGQFHWFFGNVYEAVVDLPQLLVDAQPHRVPRLLGAGSPLRYYVPAAPVTLVATVVALVDSWRSAYLVKIVNLRLLRAGTPISAAEGRSLVRTWQRGNVVRLLLLGIAAWALRRTAHRAPARRTVEAALHAYPQAQLRDAVRNLSR
jgi:hypothetical protein